MCRGSVDPSSFSPGIQWGASSILSSARRSRPGDEDSPLRSSWAPRKVSSTSPSRTSTMSSCSLGADSFAASDERAERRWMPPAARLQSLWGVEREVQGNPGHRQSVERRGGGGVVVSSTAPGNEIPAQRDFVTSFHAMGYVDVCAPQLIVTSSHVLMRVSAPRKTARLLIPQT